MFRVRINLDGTDVNGSDLEVEMFTMLNSSNDNNPGSQYLPFKTINYALSQQLA